MNTFYSVNDEMFENGRSIGKLYPHIPSSFTMSHAKEKKVKLGEFVQLTGTIFAFGIPDGNMFFELI